MRENFTRRNVVQLAGVAAVGALAGCSSGSADAGDGEKQNGEPRSFGGWMEDVSNYDGVVDETGKREVTVEVGAQGNGGNYAFTPPAVRISKDTRVTWKWVAGSHDVVAEDGSFNSEMSSEAGFTFTHAFDAAGTTKYYCTPHEAMGMKGVVVVE